MDFEMRIKMQCIDSLNGPPADLFRLFCHHQLYRWGDELAWYVMSSWCWEVKNICIFVFQWKHSDYTKESQYYRAWSAHQNIMVLALSLYLYSHICGKILMIMRNLPRIRSRRKMVRSWVIARASMGNWVVWRKINIKLMNSPSLLLGLLAWKPWTPQAFFISNPLNYYILLEPSLIIALSTLVTDWLTH